MIKNRLFTPGPVSLYPPGLAAALEANIHHRTPEFKAILADVIQKLSRLLGNPAHVYLFASSGSGAMEAAVTNFFTEGDEVLVASCGKFGERWIALAERFGLRATLQKYTYGDAVDPSAIEQALRRNPKLCAVFVQACESSTGVQNDIDSIAKITKDTDALLIVDAVSALATMPLSTASGIDVLVSASQKALMIPPGLAFMGITPKAWQKVEQAGLPRFYFDLRAARKAWEENGQTAFTPATSLILSLRSSLQFLEQVGLERLIQLTENRARATRAALRPLSLELFPRNAPANAMTAVVAPGGGADGITSGMKKRFGLHLAGGQGELKGKIFRISHMGFLDHFDLLGVISALELTLRDLGQPIELGQALQEFQKVYAEVA